MSIMQPPLFAVIIAFFSATIPSVSSADTYKVGDSMVGFSAPDQHGTTVTLKAGDAKFVLFEVPAGNSDSQPAPASDWLTTSHAVLVMNISGFSSLKRKVAHSRLESEPFQILVLDDRDLAAKFPVEKDKFTVLVINEQGVITAIKFAARGPELKAVLSATP